MKIWNGSRERVASPTPAQAAYEARQNQYKNNAREAAHIVDSIARLVLNAPMIDATASVNQYRISAVGHSRLCAMPVRIARFTDGFVMASSRRDNAAALVDRLRIDNQQQALGLESAVRFTRTISNDRTELDSPVAPLDITGIGCIGESEPAMQGLRVLHELALEQQDGWRYAHTLASLQPFRVSQSELEASTPSPAFVLQ